MVLHVHEKLLASRSDVFKSLLTKRWIECEDRRVELPDDEPEIVQLYVQYLYSGHARISWTKDTSDLKDDQNLPEYYIQAELYILGEKLKDISFKDYILDCIIRRMTTPINGHCWSPVHEVVDMLYLGTAPGSPIRDLMVHNHCFRGYQHWIIQGRESHNKDFLVDLTCELLGRRPKPDSADFIAAMKNGLYRHDWAKKYGAGKDLSGLISWND